MAHMWDGSHDAGILCPQLTPGLSPVGKPKGWTVRPWHASSHWYLPAARHWEVSVGAAQPCTAAAG